MEQPGATESSAPCHTWDDFLALPDDDRRELIDGELVEVEVPTKLHEYMVGTLSFHLHLWAKRNGGLPLGSGYKVRISSTRGVLPDVQFYRAENPSAQTLADTYDSPPDLAVEILSPSSQNIDRRTKLHWYAEIGRAEYWLVDPEARELHRYVLSEGGYGGAETLRAEAIFRPGTFPGLEIPLAELWTLPGSRG